MDVAGVFIDSGWFHVGDHIVQLCWVIVPVEEDILQVDGGIAGDGDTEDDLIVPLHRRGAQRGAVPEGANAAAASGRAEAAGPTSGQR